MTLDLIETIKISIYSPKRIKHTKIHSNKKKRRGKRVRYVLFENRYISKDKLTPKKKEFYDICMALFFRSNFLSSRSNILVFRNNEPIRIRIDQINSKQS